MTTDSEKFIFHFLPTAEIFSPLVSWITAIFKAVQLMILLTQALAIPASLTIVVLSVSSVSAYEEVVDYEQQHEEHTEITQEGDQPVSNKEKKAVDNSVMPVDLEPDEIEDVSQEEYEQNM